MKEIPISKKDGGQRVDKYLLKYMPLAPVSFFYKMMRKKNIVLNKKKIEGKEILKPGDVISLFLAEDTIQGFQKDIEATKQKNSEYENAYKGLKGIRVLYENEHILALYKPANTLSQKSKPQDLSVNEWAIGYLMAEGKITEEELQIFKPSVVNRLDRNTSGMILVGKSLKGSQVLSAIIKEHSIKKFYRAICVGEFERKEDHLTGVLVKNEKTNKVSVKKSGEGEKIETKYRVLHSFTLDGQKYSYLEIQLITGKSHQIRAHLSSIGHPILGDEKYGNQKAAAKMQQKLHIDGQLLHAYRLEFPGKALEILGEMPDKLIAPLPKNFYIDPSISKVNLMG